MLVCPLSSFRAFVLTRFVLLSFLTVADARIENLRSSIERLGGDQTHTLRGLDAYQKGMERAALDEKLQATAGKVTASFVRLFLILLNYDTCGTAGTC